MWDNELREEMESNPEYKKAKKERIEAGLANPTIAIIHKIFMHLGLEIKVIPSNLPSSFGQSFASSEIERP